MKKYNINKELKTLRYFNPPINKLVIGGASFLSRLLPKCINKSKYVVEYFKIGKIKYHIITPKEYLNEKLPLIFYTHGGGFVFRAFPYHYMTEAKYSSLSKCKVVGVDYSISPKAKYPTALNECLDGLNYLMNNKDKYKLDNNIILAGDSAGGLLALDTYLNRDKDLNLNIKGLMLIYPVCDNSSEYESMKKFTDTPCWNSVKNEKMWKYYLGDKEYISPINRIEEFEDKDLKVYIETCEFDCLLDQDLKLAELLTKNGIDVLLNHTKETFHGSDCNTKANIIIEAFNKRIEFLNKVIY